MAWLNTIPSGSKDPNKKLYVFYYDPEKKTTVRRVTKFRNKYPDRTRANIWLKKFNARTEADKFKEQFQFIEEPDLFSIAFRKFLNSRIAAPSTLDSYTYASDKWISLVRDKPLHLYTRQDSIDFIKGMKQEGLSDNSIASYTKQIKVIWKWFVEEDMIQKNIIKSTPRKKSPVKTIPPEDLKIIFEHLRNKTDYPQHYKIIRLLYLTGFRPSTLAILLKENIRLKEHVIYYHNKKEEKDSIFPVHKDLKEELLTIDLSAGGLLFPGMDKKLSFFKRAVADLLRDNKIKQHYSVKMLRKTLATEIARNISDSAAQFLLDHEDKQTTRDSYIAALAKDPVFIHSASEKLRKEINLKVKFIK